MIRAALRLARGAELRHQPVALMESRTPEVEVLLESPHGTESVDGRHVPVSLAPFVIGIAAPRPSGAPGTALVLRDRKLDRAVGRVELEYDRRVELGELALETYRALDGTNSSVGPLERRLRYASAARAARRKRGGGIVMTGGDLRALDAYYIRPQLAYVVTAAGGPAGFHIFSMEYVLTRGAADLMGLAIRSSNPSVPHLEPGSELAISSIPAELAEAHRALDVFQSMPYEGTTALPLELHDSAVLSLPVPRAAHRVQEARVVAIAPVGSHVVVAAQQVADERIGAERARFGYVSALYARLRARSGLPFEEV